MMTGLQRDSFCGCLSVLLCMLAAVLFTAACGPPPPRVPLETISYEHPALSGKKLLIVLLPGNGDKASSFEKHGLIEAVRKRGIPADLVAVNAHLGYYRDGSIFRRLKEDVIDPARARGYDRIWLAGNSLGAYGSLAYLDGRAEDVAGVVLLGPFVGEKETLEEVRAAGGLRNWDPGRVGPSDWKRRLMLLLKEYQRDPGMYPPIYLGYGKRDRFAASQRFLAGILPPDRVIELDGGHEWRTWSKIWEVFLARGIIE